jgi:ABC-2 type transport system permease protein
VQSLSFFAIILLAAPIIATFALGLLVDQFWITVSPIVAVLIGFGVLFGGLYLGGRAFDRRGPELMAFATRND